MELKECFDFCVGNRDLIGQQIKTGARILNILPAPYEHHTFTRYLEVLHKSQNPIIAQAMSGAANFQPLLILEAPSWLFLYSWLGSEFPERLPQQ